MPLADDGGLVTGSLQDLREGLLGSVESQSIVEYAVDVAVLAGLDDGTAGGTDRIGDVAFIKSHAFFGDAVDVLCRCDLFKPAAVGGLTSGILVIIIQAIILKFSATLFQKYAIYGSFASIPIFLFWLHLNWTILLFGAELAFAIQNRDTYAEEQASVRASMVSKLWVAFSVMQEAVRVFQGSDASMNATQYARANNIPIRLMNEVIQVLARAHLLGAVLSDGQDSFALLQAPEHVTAKKIYDLMITDGSSPEDLGLVKDVVTDEVLSTVDISLDETLDPITLRRFTSDGK